MATIGWDSGGQEDRFFLVALANMSSDKVDQFAHLLIGLHGGSNLRLDWQKRSLTLAMLVARHLMKGLAPKEEFLLHERLPRKPGHVPPCHHCHGGRKDTRAGPKMRAPGLASLCTNSSIGSPQNPHA